MVIDNMQETYYVKHSSYCLRGDTSTMSVLRSTLVTIWFVLIVIFFKISLVISETYTKSHSGVNILTHVLFCYFGDRTVSPFCIILISSSTSTTLKQKCKVTYIQNRLIFVSRNSLRHLFIYVLLETHCEFNTGQNLQIS